MSNEETLVVKVTGASFRGLWYQHKIGIRVMVFSIPKMVNRTGGKAKYPFYEVVNPTNDKRYGIYCRDCTHSAQKSRSVRTVRIL
jgi:hypothetical protein